ncbi:hypothetical protein [Streptomyces sp. NPDC102490]
MRTSRRRASSCCEAAPDRAAPGSLRQEPEARDPAHPEPEE